MDRIADVPGTHPTRPSNCTTAAMQDDPLDNKMEDQV